MHTPGWIKRIKTPKVAKKGRIPIYAPFITETEKQLVLQCLSDTWLSSKGKYVTEFEKKFAEFCGSPYAVSCSSGTAALFLVLKLLNIKKGDEVIVPTFTMISTAFAVSYTGAKPIFVDCDPTSGNLSISDFERHITSKTKVVIPVHIYGNPCNLDEIHHIAKKYHLTVFEDAAEAFGSTYKNNVIGNTSDFAAFSLYINKVITTGEGGMITLRSRELYHKLKRLNNYYFSSKRHFWHEHIGYNFRLSNVQAAIGLGQLTHANQNIKNKQQIAKWYEYYLKPCQEYLTPYSVNPEGKSNYWHVAYRAISEKVDVMKLRNTLGKSGVETRGPFIPLHLQPAYRKTEFIGQFPHAEHLAQTSILLPSGPTLEEQQIERISTLITKFFKK